jgi:bifunctional DNA-binding transcriptional regulator/antitoxin component of YhaV-PrlF toxin-antitoxin module
MSTSRVDERHRIVIDKRTRERVHIRTGDVVVIEPLDSHSFKVKLVDFSKGNVEDDPGWKAFHPPAKAKKYIPPQKLEKFLEEKVWLE